MLRSPKMPPSLLPSRPPPSQAQRLRRLRSDRAPGAGGQRQNYPSTTCPCLIPFLWRGTHVATSFVHTPREGRMKRKLVVTCGGLMMAVALCAHAEDPPAPAEPREGRGFIIGGSLGPGRINFSGAGG